MKKKLLFICDPLESFKIQGDTTYSLLLAANESSYEVYYSLAKNVYQVNNMIYSDCRRLTFYCKSYDKPNLFEPWYSESEIQILRHDIFYAILIRNDPPFNMEYYYLTQILSYAEAAGTKVINSSYGLRNFNEKLSILNFPKLIIDTLVAKDYRSIKKFIDKHEECVIKPLNLMAGRGIFKISRNEVNFEVIIESSTDYYTQTIMVQKFIPEVVLGDKRIFVINGMVMEYCLHRVPQNNQIRGNIAVGGKGEVKRITKDDYELVQEVAVWLRTNNIIFAGLDVIGNYLTEINITSPTGTRLILENTGLNIPKIIIESI